jgi:hypothetical protein
MAVAIHQHGAPYHSYGGWASIDLLTDYQTYVWAFTTVNFTEPVADGRLRFWFAPYANAGDAYLIDNVVLTKAPGAGSINAAAVNGITVDDAAGLLAGGDMGDSRVGEPIAAELFLPLVVR